MTSNAPGRDRILGTLRSEEGKGVVRMEDRYDTDIDDLWSALTDPPRLARWYGEVEGDLRPGGEFDVRVTDAWEGTGRVDACEPPRRLLVTMRDADPQPGQPDEWVIEAQLTADGGQTVCVPRTRFEFYRLNRPRCSWGYGRRDQTPCPSRVRLCCFTRARE
jgi:uncharacterized protein YndB with AHSA1/START domain